MDVKNVFKMPNSITVKARISTITNAFVSSIIPCINPTEEEIKENLRILHLDYEDLKCAYCGDKCTEWDHLRPIVKNKRPTGYISDIYNLVPSCGKCNQSKGNTNWDTWIISDAKFSPKTRRVNNLEDKIDRLKDFENWKKVEPIKFEDLVDVDIWDEHWRNCDKLHDFMKQYHQHALKVKKQIEDRI